jgi:hypothetical protein
MDVYLVCIWRVFGGIWGFWGVFGVYLACIWRALVGIGGLWRDLGEMKLDLGVKFG